MNPLYYRLKKDKNYVEEPPLFSWMHARNANGSPIVAAFRQRTGWTPSEWFQREQVIFYKDGTFHREIDVTGVYLPVGLGPFAVNPIATTIHMFTDGIPGFIRKMEAAGKHNRGR
jgi:hypothetical protein